MNRRQAIPTIKWDDPTIDYHKANLWWHEFVDMWFKLCYLMGRGYHDFDTGSFRGKVP